MNVAPLNHPDLQRFSFPFFHHIFFEDAFFSFRSEELVSFHPTTSSFLYNFVLGDDSSIFVAFAPILSYLFLWFINGFYPTCTFFQNFFGRERNAFFRRTCRDSSFFWTRRVHFDEVSKFRKILEKKNTVPCLR